MNNMHFIVIICWHIIIVSPVVIMSANNVSNMSTVVQNAWNCCMKIYICHFFFHILPVIFYNDKYTEIFHMKYGIIKYTPKKYIL